MVFSGGRSSVGRVPDCDSGCRGFEPRRSPHRISDLKAPTWSFFRFSASYFLPLRADLAASAARFDIFTASAAAMAARFVASAASAEAKTEDSSA
jgi:hypothetical protein